MAYKKNNRGSYVLGSEGKEFTVTKKEYQEMQTLVKRANQRRVDTSERYFNQMVGANVMVGVEYDQYMKILNQKGFITEKYSTRLDQFKNKNDVRALLKELNTVTQKGYGHNRIDDVRYKMIEQIDTNYGIAGEDIITRIKELSDGELLSMYLMADKDIIEALFYVDGDDDFIYEQATKVNTYIDTLLEGNRANKLDKKVFQKGFRNYKQRQRTKKKKRGN